MEVILAYITEVESFSLVASVIIIEMTSTKSERSLVCTLGLEGSRYDFPQQCTKSRHNIRAKGVFKRRGDTTYKDLIVDISVGMFAV